MILALKTAGPITELTLLQPNAASAPTPPPVPLATLTWESGRTLADQLLSRLTVFLADHHAALVDLTGIIIFSGPGSFTSLRIGHAVANALADSLGIPIVGAGGEDWIAVATQQLTRQSKSQPALPDYGAEAHITRPAA